MLFALRTNVHEWMSDFQKSLDDGLIRAGVRLIDLHWERFELLSDDREHFTWDGLTAFAANLADAMKAELRDVSSELHIISDSTIDYWNYDCDGSYDGKADACVVRAFENVGIKATVDAVNGSGFIALRKMGAHFRARKSRASVELIIGGWNDRHYGTTHTVNAVNHYVRPRR